MRLALPLVVAIALVAAGDARAATCEFNAVAADWNAAASWSCGHVPNSADTAVVGVGKNAHVAAAPVPVGHVTINGGTLTFGGNHVLAVSDATLDGGLTAGAATITGPGTIVLDGGLTRSAGDNQLLITGGADVVLNGASTLDQGYVCLNHADSQLRIDALFTIANGANANAFNCGSGAIVVGPAGELRSARTTNTTVVSAPLDNDGIVRASAGILQLNGGGLNQHAGTFTTGFGTLTFNSAHTLASTGSITTVGGTIAVAGGTVTVPSGAAFTPGSLSQSGGSLVLQGVTPVTIPTHVINGGVLTSTRNVTSTAFTVGAATLTGDFALTVPVGGTFTRAAGDHQLQLTGGADLVLDNAVSTLDNGYVCLNASDSTLRINALFFIADGANPNAFNCGSGAIVVSPTGELRSTRGTNATVVSARLDNDGTVRASAGILQLNGNGVDEHTGMFFAADPGTLQFNSNHTLGLNGAITGADGSTIAVSGGTVTVSADAGFSPHTLSQSGGNLVLQGAPAVTIPHHVINGGVLTSTRNLTSTTLTVGAATLTGDFSLTVPGGGTFTRAAGDHQLQLTGGADLVLDNAVSTLDNGYVCLNAPDSSLQVNALFVIANGANPNAFNCGSGTIVIGPSGELRSTRTTNPTVVSARLDNDGVVRASQGTLQLNGTGLDQHAGSFVAADTGTLVFNGNHALAATGSITGATGGLVAVAGGTVTVPSGASFTPASLSQSGGNLVLQGTSAVAVQNHVINGGVLTGTRDVTSTALTVGAATLTGDFSLTVPVGGSFTRAAGDHQLQLTGGADLVLDNASSTLDNGYVCLNSAESRLQVNALFTIANGANANAFNCGSGTIVVGPSGELRSTRTTNPTVVSAQLDNGGVVNAAAGVLQLHGGGAAPHAGTFRAADNAIDPATLLFNANHTLAATGSITSAGNGTITVSGGTVTVPSGAGFSPARLAQNGGNLALQGVAPVTIPTHAINGGVLTSTRDVTSTAFTAGSATLAGDFDLTVPASGSFARTAGDHQLQLTAGADLVLDNATSTLDNGYVCVNGAGSNLRVNGLFTIANGANPNAFNCGTGAIVIGPGGELRTTRTTNATTIGNPVSNTGGTFTVPAAVQLNVNNGLTQSAGETVVDGTLTGLVSLTGTSVLRGSGQTGSVDNAAGIVRPGSSPGTLTIAGNYTQGAAGQIDVEIAGTAPGAFDVLAVSGAAALAGTVRYVLLGFTPAATDQFRFLTSGSAVTGTPTVTGDPVPGGLTFSVLKPASAPFGAVLALSAPGAPVNQTRPTITGSGTLTCNPGTWTNSPALTYQWLRDGAVIATGTQYTVVGADATHQLVCRETATNLGGTATADSDPVTIPATAPQDTAPPTITGTPAVGSVLTCNPGTFSGAPAPALGYQWLRDGAVIATGAQYTVVGADATHQLACRETATNAGGSDSADSAPVSIPAVAPQSTTPPSIGGQPAVGSALTCDPGAFSGFPAPALSIQWQRDDEPISGATGAAYTPVGADAGRRLTCRVTATNAGGSASATSASVAVPVPVVPTPTPTPSPEPTASPTPTPTPEPPSPTAVAEQQLAAAPPSQVAGAFGLPPTRRCVSRRRFTITLRPPRNVTIRAAQVRLNGKRVKVRRAGSRFKATIDLRGLPRGTFKVAIRITTGTGRRLNGQRRYRTCVPKGRS